MKQDTLRVILINLLAPVLGGIMVLLAGCGSPEPKDITGEPTPSAIETAQRQYASGQYDDAYDTAALYLSKHDEKDTFYGDANFVAGKAASRLENFSLAVLHLERAVDYGRTGRNKAEAKLLLGDTYYGSAAYDKAVACYDDVLAYNKGNASVKPDELYFKLGMAWKFVPNADESDKYFERIMDEYRHGNFYQMARREHSRIGGKDAPLKFFLAIGEYPSKVRAEEVVQALETKGYTAGIQELEQKETGAKVFRVAMENFETPKEARVMQRKLASENIDSEIMP